MKEFIVFARRMVHDRLMLAVAMVFALLSAGGMGLGILLMIPTIKLILDQDGAGSLPALGVRFNAEGREWLGVPIQIPQWLINVVPTGQLAGVIWVIAGIAALTVVGACFNFLHQYLSITVATRTVARARLQIFETAMFMPLVRVHERGASEFVSRIIRDSAAVQRGLIALMSKAVANVTQAVVMFMVALLAGGSLTLGAVIVVPILAIVLRKIGKRIRRGTHGALQQQERLLRISTESIQGLRAVKANTGEASVIDRFEIVNREVVRQELRARIARALSGPIVETIAVFAVGLLIIVAARDILAGGLTIERFVLALGSLAIAGSKFKVLAGLVNELQASSPPARRMMDVLAESGEAPDGRQRPDLPPHKRRIRVEGAILTYPGAEEPALRGVDLEIQHGQRVAIVGPNGCGKTSLVSLVPRLLVPDSGRVIIDDTNVADVNLHSLRKRVAVVTQETVLFRRTIAENIGFGTEAVTPEQIEDAARRAHAHEFIMQIPGGYDANVAEQGTSLSGGQRQRLTIARAILRNPDILILDEATSQIDAESEAHISAAMTEFCRGRTVLLIAHRLATVLDADLIIVMEAGRVIDQGRHDELLGRCSLYRRLSQTQLISAAG